MEIVFEIALALIVGKVLGELAERIQLPSLVGYIVSGFGLAQLGLIHPEHLELFSVVGLIFLLFLAAFQETNVEEILKDKFTSIFFGTGGVVCSLILGLIIGQIFDMSLLESFFIGTALSATSISISLGIFINTEKLNTKIGRAVLGSAIVDDILALLILAVLSGFALSNTSPLDGLTDISLGIVIFIAITFAVYKLLPSLIEVVRKMRIEESLFTVVVVIVLMIAYVSELLGLSIVIGAFFAGVVLSKVNSGVLKTRQFSEKLSAVAYGFFVPFFFIHVGAELEPVFTMSWLTVSIIIAGFLGKIISAYAGYKITSFSVRELTIMAFSRLPRGEVILVIAALGKTVGIVSTEVFNALLLLIFITIIVTPIILTPMLRKTDLK